MSQIQQRDNLDELWFQMRARKTINFPYPEPINPRPANFPNNVEVVQLDFNNIGVKLLNDPFYTPDVLGYPAAPNINKNELKLMLLLKV